MPIAASTAFTIKVQDMGSYFEITTSTATSTNVYQYAHRLDPECINSVLINGGSGTVLSNVEFYASSERLFCV